MIENIGSKEFSTKMHPNYVRKLVFDDLCETFVFADLFDYETPIEKKSNCYNIKTKFGNAQVFSPKKIVINGQVLNSLRDARKYIERFL